MTTIQQYFKDYPGKDKCFETADGLIFHERGDANMHASSLKDNDVITHSAKKSASEPEKVVLTAKEMAEAKVKGFTKDLERAKTPAAKAKVQKSLDAAMEELTKASEPVVEPDGEVE